MADDVWGALYEKDSDSDKVLPSEPSVAEEDTQRELGFTSHGPICHG